MSTPYNEKRREFLRSIARFAVLGGAVAGVAGLTRKHGETCVNQGICSGCPVFADCGLPAALSAKATGRQEHV